MFSEYASRFLTKPRAAPLFQGSTASVDSDTEAFLGWVDNSVSESSEDLDANPPEDITIERQQAPPPPEIPVRRSDRLEAFVGAAYIVSASMTLAVATLISFSTYSSPVGVYPVFGKSARTLVVLGLLSIAGSWAWLEAMRRNPKGMVQLNVFLVPVTCVSITVYAMVGSIHNVAGHSLVHTAMRVFAALPLAAAAGWVFILRRDKHKLNKASEMIALALRVINGCPGIIWVAGICGVGASLLSFLWVLFVSRAFLEGSLSILLGLLFSFQYFWTWALLCNLQRCIITVYTSNWVNGTTCSNSSLFIEVAHRFGGCATSGLVVCARGVGGRFAQFALARSKIADPMTLTVAVTKRSSLSAAAAVPIPDNATFNLAKMVLRATKLTFALLVAFVGWINADRTDTVASAYSWLIAVATFGIGWTVFGAADNTLAMVLEGLLVCNSLSPAPELRRVFD